MFVGSLNLNQKSAVLLGFIFLIGFLLLNPKLISLFIHQIGPNHIILSFDSKEKLVALTIDDGPHPTITPLILDLLKKHQAKATFFLTGKNIQENPEIVKRIIDEGHEIGNHMQDHNFSILLEASEAEDQLLITHNLITAYQPSTKWFRPGGGLTDRALNELSHSHGYSTVIGSVYPFDALIPEEYGGEYFITRYIDRNIHPGAIIILHDGRIRTIRVLENILPTLVNDGYQFVTLSELDERTKNRS